MNGHVSKSTFAKIYGCAPSYVTKLIDEKKIVLSEDGKKVNVDASLTMLKITSDPSKQGVRDRWSAYRDGKSIIDVPAQLACADDAPPAGRRGGVPDSGGSEYHKARTQSEQVKAKLQELDLLERLSQVAQVAPIIKAVLDTHMGARAAVMQLPDRLSQLIAPETDPQKVHEILRLECERICDQVQRNVLRLRELVSAEKTEIEQ